MLAGEPKRDVVTPDVVAELADGRPIRAVWENQVGGLTFEIGQDPQRHFVKWAPAGRAWEIDAEVKRLRWAFAYAPVPEMIDTGHDATGAWLLTLALPGHSAVAARWISDPETAVRAIGVGLRALHDALPADNCPFSWSVDDRVADAHRRADVGLLDSSTWHPVHQHLSVAEALGFLAAPPPIDRPVVCHGDACAPNTLIGPDGRCTGHVDLGSLGVADRWADLAVATWSTEWNYGPGWEPHLLAAYGIDPDPDRTRYYRLLWDLGP